MSSEPKPFRLLDLPFVAQRDVFKDFAPLEVFDLYLCSKRMAALAKSGYNHCRMIFEVTLSETITLGVSKFGPAERGSAVFELSWTEEILEPIVREINGMSFISKRVAGKTRETSQWKTKEDAVEGASYYFKALFDVFNFKSWSAVVYSDGTKEEHSPILSWIRQIQSKMGGERMRINGHLLEDMVRYEIVRYRQENISKFEKENVRDWIVRQTGRISIDSIFELNFVTLNLRKSYLTDKDLNLLIRRLLIECKERMERISIQVRHRMDRMVVFEGTNAHRVEKLPIYNVGGYQFQSVCGKIWSVLFNEDRLSHNHITIYSGDREEA